MKTKKFLTSLRLAAGTIVTTNTSGRSAAVSSTVQFASIEPGAIHALHKMGAYLRTLKAIQVKVTTAIEDVLPDGQKLQSTASIDLLARQPDRLRAIVTSDNKDRTYYYDGQTFTVWAQRVNSYATVAAPAKIDQLARQLDEKLGIDLPLVDLFRWGTSESDDAEIISALDVGLALIDGSPCTQYAFCQAGLDWQIWIQNGNHPLPRKLILTTLTEEARPQAAINYTWNLAPAFDDDAFTFSPVAGALRISLAESSTAAPPQKRSPNTGRLLKAAPRSEAISRHNRLS